MHQLMTLDAVVVANDRIVAADAGSPGGMWLPKCLPPVPSITMNTMTLGIHATVSYLCAGRCSHYRTFNWTMLAHQWMTRYPKNVTWCQL